MDINNKARRDFFDMLECGGIDHRFDHLRNPLPPHFTSEEINQAKEEYEKLDFNKNFSDNFKQKITLLGQCAKKQLEINDKKYKECLVKRNILFENISQEDIEFNDEFYDDELLSTNDNASLKISEDKLLKITEECLKLKSKCDFYSNMCDFLHAFLYGDY